MTSDKAIPNSSMLSTTVLIVDDDPHIRQVIRFALNKAGYTTIEAADGQQGLSEFHRHSPDIIILDILMPEMNGSEVCAAIRKTSDTPIIFLSSMDDEVDRIIGLETGGDDYVTKPFSPRELVARVKVILKRSSQPQQRSSDDQKQILRHGQLKLDPQRFLVLWDDTAIPLTAIEFTLVEILLGAPGRVFSREELCSRAYRDSFVSDRTIDSHIRKIRSKFKNAGAQPIETVRSVGYKIASCR